ncbi:MAG: helix-turn-helix transcriptional regulator [Ferruginibacter sp.]
MIINIKNMVCQRCEIVVNTILENLGLEAVQITIGEIMLRENLPNYKLKQLDAALKETGLEIIRSKKSLIVEKIKKIIFETIYYPDESLVIKFSCYLSEKLNYSYTYLSNLFSRENGISIERYIILQKIEKVKSMLISENAVLSEIAHQMKYSSVAHLSAQFKKVTGVTARDYKALRIHAYTRMPGRIAV